MHGNIQIACRTAVSALGALTVQTDLLTVVDACWDRHLQPLAQAHHTGASAVGAGIFDDLTGASAVGTSLGGLHYTHKGLLRDTDLSLSVTLGTGLRGAACCGTASLTVAALFDTIIGNLLLAAEHRLFEGDGDLRLQILPSGGTVTACLRRASTAEEAGEKISQIAEISGKSAESAATRAHIGINACVAILVVASLLIGIRQHLVGLVHFLEALFRLGVAGMQVGVILLGHLAIGLFDLIIRGAFLKSQHLVIIAFCFSHCCSPLFS